MPHPEQRLREALDKLEQIVEDRQERAQRDEWEFLKRAAELEQRIYDRYKNEQHDWIKAQSDSHVGRSAGRRNGIWETS